VHCPVAPRQINQVLSKNGIIGGLDISHTIDNSMLLCVTEVNTKQDIDRLVEILRQIIER
jgi:glycine dehydrogenase subunit 1